MAEGRAEPDPAVKGLRGQARTLPCGSREHCGSVGRTRTIKHTHIHPCDYCPVILPTGSQTLSQLFLPPTHPEGLYYRVLQKTEP